MFKVIDVDGSGTLTLDEFKSKFLHYYRFFDFKREAEAIYPDNEEWEEAVWSQEG